MGKAAANPSLGHALAILRRRALGVMLCVIVAGGAAFGFSQYQAKQYTATASLLFDNNQTSQQVAGLQPAVTNNAQSQQDTNIRLVQIGDMAAITAKRLGLAKQAVTDNLSITPQGDTTVANVSAIAASPTLAAQIANTYSQIFVDEQQSATTKYYKSALATVNKQLLRLSPQQRLGAQALALQERAQSLATLAQLRTGVKVAQPASIPAAPSSPRVVKNVVIGAILGLLLGLTIAIMLERFDQRIREPTDLAAVYNLPLLGVIPDSSALSSSRWRRRRRQKSRGGALSGSEAEAFQLIRVQLRYFNVDRELRTLLVVSAAPSDGKTTVASRLAGATASTGSRVLLVEADLRGPQPAEELDFGRKQGLADVLIGAISMEAAIEHLSPDTVPKDASNRRALDVLVSGAGAPPNPGELLESHAMEAVLEEAKSAYDLVIIDTPPLGVVSDAFPLLRKVDGVIIVGWIGRTRRDVAQRLSDTLVRVGAPMLGVVANGFKTRGSPPYGYAYDSPRVLQGDRSVARSSADSVPGTAHAQHAGPDVA